MSHIITLFLLAITGAMIYIWPAQVLVGVLYVLCGILGLFALGIIYRMVFVGVNEVLDFLIFNWLEWKRKRAK